jgi:IS1 family transposase
MTLSAGELWQIILSILAGPTVLVGWIIAVHIRQTLTRIELKAALKGLIHDRFRSRDQTISKPSCANGGIHTWHLDEMAVLIAGRQFWLWHAVDDEGEVLDLLVQRRRDESAAVKLMHKLLKKQGFPPAMLVTDKLRSYGVARSEMGFSARHEQGCARTIAPRIRINRLDDASGRSSVPNRPDQPSASCPFTPPFTTRSTSNAISLPAARFAS